MNSTRPDRSRPAERMAMIRMTPETLAALLQLPAGARIEAIEPHAPEADVLHLRVRGAGYEVRTGDLIPYAPHATVRMLSDGENRWPVVTWDLPEAEQPSTEWDDPRAQIVYEVLCSDEVPPEGHHWEGFAARRIVDALFPGGETSCASAPYSTEAGPQEGLPVVHVYGCSLPKTDCIVAGKSSLDTKDMDGADKSVALNRVVWLLAEALGRVPEGADVASLEILEVTRAACAVIQQHVARQRSGIENSVELAPILGQVRFGDMGAFWDEAYPSGMLAEDVRRELADYVMVMEEATKVYEAVTGGRFTKPNTAAVHVINEFERVLSERVCEEVRDLLEVRAVLALGSEGAITDGELLRLCAGDVDGIGDTWICNREEVAQGLRKAFELGHGAWAAR